jgi:transposase IS116/IS110/IS902 family protein
VGTVKFEARIKELVENLPDLAELVEPLLIVRRTLREQIGILHRRLLAIVRDDDVCRRLMTVPGVSPVVALTYRATVDVPARFRNSKAVGADGLLSFGQCRQLFSLSHVPPVPPVPSVPPPQNETLISVLSLGSHL